MSDKAKIAELNDRFRKDPARYGKAYTTDGVAALGPEFVTRAFAAVAAFQAFNADNDPWGEHDFGAIEIDGEKLFWKVEHFDKRDPDFGAEDPSNPETTERILTLMLPEEY